MRRSISVLAPAVLLLLAAIGASGNPFPQTKQTLPQARKGFVTHLITKSKTPDAVDPPPSGFELVHYRAHLGSYPGYLAMPYRKAGHLKGRHPVILWIVGGFSNSIGDTSWTPATPDNDQSARAFYESGIMTFYPSLRGGNNNPGYLEGGYGEVDDIIAAANYLAHRPDVDPKRIYLGGHSTGGTLAMLVAESTTRFRAIFAFGPVAFTSGYGQDTLPYDIHNDKEDRLRSPIYFMGAVQTPTYVFEGTVDSNIKSLQVMNHYNHNPRLHFYSLPGLTHFSELAQVTPMIAKHVRNDTSLKRAFSW